MINLSLSSKFSNSGSKIPPLIQNVYFLGQLLSFKQTHLGRSKLHCDPAVTKIRECPLELQVLHQQNALPSEAHLAQCLHHLLILTKTWYSLEESDSPTSLPGKKEKQQSLQLHCIRTHVCFQNTSGTLNPDLIQIPYPLHNYLYTVHMTRKRKKTMPSGFTLKP